MNIRLVLSSLVLLLSATAFASVRTVPFRPQAGEPFDLVFEDLTTDSCRPEGVELEIHNDVLLVTFDCNPWPDTPGPHPGGGAVVEGLRLAGGTYWFEGRIRTPRLAPLGITESITVEGSDGGIRSVIPSSDTVSGNGVVRIQYTQSCETCPLEVWFGSNRSPKVDRFWDHLLAVAPPSSQGAGTVDVKVVHREIEAVRPSGFTYDSPEKWEALLFPVYTRSEVAGAHGSRWVTEAQFFNQNDVSLYPFVDYRNGHTSCFPQCGEYPETFPADQGRAFTLTLPHPTSDVPPTAIFWVRRDAAPFVTGALRARDLSRQAESWGTEIPLAREYDFQPSLVLMGIPVTPRFRQKLRIYAIDREGEVTVKFSGPLGGVSLGEITVTPRWPEGARGGSSSTPFAWTGSNGLPLQPAYAEVDLNMLGEVAGQPEITVRVEGAGGTRIWAFVAITNDETQQITTVSPQ